MQDNDSENVVYKPAGILCLPQCVNSWEEEGGTQNTWVANLHIHSYAKCRAVYVSYNMHGQPSYTAF